MTQPPREPTRRLFFALWPSAAERNALVVATQPALAGLACAPVPVANLHVTLLFLGTVEASRLVALSELAAAIAARWDTGVISLCFTQLEHWPGPRIVCAVARETHTAAVSLSTALRVAASRAGFVPDLKPFRAHVTVARKVARAAPGALAPVTWHSAAFALVASRSVGGASVYSVVESHLLVKAEKVHEKP